jgi:hypothetical protein
MIDTKELQVIKQQFLIANSSGDINKIMYVLDYIPALLDLIAEKDKRIAELARVTAERDALREFAIRASRDFTECDKMFLHVGSLKQDSGYNAYMVDARQSGAVPLTFEQWLRGPEQEAR